LQVLAAHFSGKSVANFIPGYMSLEDGGHLVWVLQ
jgi:hypothetical protein